MPSCPKIFCRASYAGAVLSLIFFTAFVSPAWAVGTASPLIDELSRSTGGQVDVFYHPSTSLVRFLHLKQPDRSPQLRALSEGKAAEPAARGFLGRYGELFGLSDQSKELSVERVTSADSGRSFVRFQQRQNDIPVFGGELIVQTDPSGVVVSVSGKTAPRTVQYTTPSIDSAGAADRALQLAGKKYQIDRADLTVTTPGLWIYNPSLLDSGPNVNRLVWRLEVKATGLRLLDELVLVDAQSGNVVLHFSQIRFVKDRKIYDDNNTPTSLLPGDIGFPGTLARSEDDPATADTDVDNAYYYAGLTYDFYHDYLGRDSIDGNGMQLKSTVRYCDDIHPCPLTDVYWDTTHEQMVYGQGYASALDIVAHEITHGVTQHTSRLFNYMQSGAIAESLSDVFGKLVQLQYEPPPAGERWLIGQGLNLCGPPHLPLRDIQNPVSYIDCARYYDADRMTSPNYYCSTSGADGLHRNAGVNNKAAYLMVDGSSAEPGGVFNGYSVTGIGIVKVAKIYYEAQTNLLTSGSDYEDLYYALQLACGNLIGTAGITDADCVQVTNAVDAVEMNIQPTNCSAPEAPLCGTGLVPKDVFFDDFEGAVHWSHAATSGADAWVVPEGGYAKSGISSIWGEDVNDLSASYVATDSGVDLPAGAYLHFNHAYDFEAQDTDYYDGGVLEYLTNDAGAQWTDAGSLIIGNGYGGTITTEFDNPFAGRPAFVGTSNGYISSSLDLSGLAGKNVNFRFGIGTDAGAFPGLGWYIDDFRIYTCADAPVKIDSLPQGLQVIADGISCTTPCAFDWLPGSTHTLNAVSPQGSGDGIQYVFTSWSDSQPRSHSIVVPGTPTTTYTAYFEASSYELVSSASLADAGTISPDCSRGCWYAGSPLVSLTAAAGAGYIFTSWSGDCGGLDLTTSVLMDGPKICTANFCTPANIGGVSKDSLQMAFNDVQAGNSIRVVAGVLIENADFAAGVSAVLLGGYDCAFSEPPPASSYSILQGSLTITSGTITVENLIIR
jgi:bacillolysin